MEKKTSIRVSALTLTLLLTNVTSALAAHPDVKLQKWLVVSSCNSGACTGGSKAGSVCTNDQECVGYVKGADIAPVAAVTEPYSPRATCARACHIADGDTIETPGHDYGSGLSMTTHDQGVRESDGKIYWQSYQTKAFAHGVSVGRHMEEGRNEKYTNLERSNYALPWFTSTPGMAGKF